MYYQPDGVSLWYFKLRKLDKTELKVWDFKGLIHIEWQTIGIRKSDFVGKFYSFG